MRRPEQREFMGASSYVGRVGKLAVALGVGTAVITGHGIAAADGTDGTDNSPDKTSTSAPANPDATEVDPSAAPTGATTPPKAASSPTDGSDKESKPTSVPAGVVSAQTNTGTAGTKPAPNPPTEPAVEPSTQPSTEPEPDPEPSPEPEPDPAPVPAPETEHVKKNDSPRETNDDAGKVQQPPAVAQTATARDAEAASTSAAPEEPKQLADIASEAVSTETSATPFSAASTARSTSAVENVEPTPPAAPLDPLTAVARLVSNVVDMVIGPLFGRAPNVPAEPPLAWTLLAYARREFDSFVAALTGGAPSIRTGTTEPTSLALAARALANVPGFPLAGSQLSPSTQFVNWVTGGYQVLGTDGELNPYIADTLTRFGVSGTDVGVMWDNGIADDPLTDYNEHQVLIAFGDTFGLRNVPGEDWRFNVLMRSSDTYLADGMDVPDGEFGNGNWFGGMPLWDVPRGRPYENYARRIINPEALPPGVAPGITLIPTAGIALPSTDPDAVGGMTQYLSFMSVRQWGAAGQWTTNYSGIAYSIDNGENWAIAPSSIRYNDAWSGNANFQQAAFVRPGDGYVYSYGTPNGRQGAAYLSRVLEKDILDASKYEYWNKGSAGGWFGIGATPAGWKKGNPAAATAVFGGEQGACGSLKTGSQVSEMSVQYNKQLNKYVTLYGDQNNSIVMRTSDTPQGTWSDPKILLNQQQGGIYAPMMHPWSPSTLGTGSDLYWNLSLWSEYNVMLMKTDLTKV